jgi:hypothetical protein
MSTARREHDDRATVKPHGAPLCPIRWWTIPMLLPRVWRAHRSHQSRSATLTTFATGYNASVGILRRSDDGAVLVAVSDPRQRCCILARVGLVSLFIVTGIFLTAALMPPPTDLVFLATVVVATVNVIVRLWPGRRGIRVPGVDGDAVEVGDLLRIDDAHSDWAPVMVLLQIRRWADTNRRTIVFAAANEELASHYQGWHGVRRVGEATSAINGTVTVFEYTPRALR